MRKVTKRFIISLFFVVLVLSPLAINISASADDLPGPQLVTDAWMFIAAYKADPETLKALLPEGLEPSPEGQVVINMYTVPEGTQTSGLGPYTLTYLTIELARTGTHTLWALTPHILEDISYTTSTAPP